MTDSFNEMVSSYLDFCKRRQKCQNTSTLDLTDCEWFYPTALLPLGNFLKEKRDSINYSPPSSSDVENYFSLMINEEIASGEGDTYIPIVSLPTDPHQANSTLERIFRLQNSKDYGGENSFKYVVSELTDNIYQHSQFTNAFIMAQKYPKKGFTEVCFFDNGISIPGNFERNGMVFKDPIAISEAINGLSTINQ